MAGYLGNIPTPQATQTRDTFTATSGQTSFATSGYTVGMLDVYLNGVKLSAADITATNGSDVVIAAASAGDILEVVSFSTFDSASGAFSVGLKSDSLSNFSGDQDSGIDLSTNDVVAVKTANTERMRIDSTGKVGIGVTPPTDAQVGVYLNGGGATYSTSSTYRYDMVNAYFSDAWKYIGNGVATQIYHANGAITFSTASSNSSGAGASLSWSERMRIDSTGGLRVGHHTNIFNTAASEKASIKNAATGNALTLEATDVTGGYPILWLYSSDSTASQNAVTFQRTGGGVGTITTSASSTAYNTSSDYRLKENVTTSWDATSRLKQLKPSRFNFKVDKDTTVDGFLAHEVSSVVPEAITGEKDAVDKDGNPIMQGIDQSKLVPLLVKAIQELSAKNDTLETQVADLITRVKALEAK